MAKAVVVPTSTQVVGVNASISYTVSLIASTNVSYGSEFVINTSVAISTNITNWKNLIIAQAADRGVTLTVSDVILFGATS